MAADGADSIQLSDDVIAQPTHMRPLLDKHHRTNQAALQHNITIFDNLLPAKAHGTNCPATPYFLEPPSAWNFPPLRIQLPHSLYP